LQAQQKAEEYRYSPWYFPLIQQSISYQLKLLLDLIWPGNNHNLYYWKKGADFQICWRWIVLICIQAVQAGSNRVHVSLGTAWFCAVILAHMLPLQATSVTGADWDRW